MPQDRLSASIGAGTIVLSVSLMAKYLKYPSRGGCAGFFNSSALPWSFSTRATHGRRANGSLVRALGIGKSRRKDCAVHSGQAMDRIHSYLPMVYDYGVRCMMYERQGATSQMPVSGCIYEPSTSPPSPPRAFALPPYLTVYSVLRIGLERRQRKY